jgi:hypothetical protein
MAGGAAPTGLARDRPAQRHGPGGERRRLSNPEFTFQRDAVHPDTAGHWCMAQQLIHWCGDEQAATAASPQAMLAAKGLPESVFDLVRERTNLRRNAYLSAAGHQRPGIKAGLPVPEAEQQAIRLAEQIQEELK